MRIKVKNADISTLNSVFKEVFIYEVQEREGRPSV